MQWFAYREAVGRWTIGQLRIFLRTVAPDRYDEIPGRDRRRRAPLEAVTRRVILNHPRSAQIEGLRKLLEPKHGAAAKQMAKAAFDHLEQQASR